MGFQSDNKNFIHIRLRSEMKELDPDERQNRYEKIRRDTRKRYYNSYNENDKLNFYREVILTLSEFEIDFIFRNIFFEKDLVAIVTFLENSGCLKPELRQYFRSHLNLLFFDEISSKINSNGQYIKADLENFVKQQFINSVESVRESDWVSESIHNNPLITKYADWLTVQLSGIPNEKHIDSFILFTKIWNHFPVFTNPFHNSKAIVFYTRLIDHIEVALKISDAFYLEELLTKTKLKDVVPPIEYLPLLDDYDSESYKPGYIIIRSRFNELLDQYKFKNSINKSNSYDDLINTYFNSEDQSIRKKVLKSIEDKLASFMIPTRLEINFLYKEDVDKSDDLVQLFIHRLYLIELI